MSISSIGAAATAALQSKAVPTLVASQQEALKEASTGIKDGDEPLVGTAVNTLA